MDLDQKNKLFLSTAANIIPTFTMSTPFVFYGSTKSPRQSNEPHTRTIRSELKKFGVYMHLRILMIIKQKPSEKAY